MATPSEILGEMYSSAPQQSNALADSISQVQEQITVLTNQIDAIETGICEVAQTNLTTYLNNTKLAEIESIYGGTYQTPFSVSYGSNYGTIDYTTGGITDFKIIDSTGGTVYKYNSTNWDSDTTITKLISDYAFGNDYITRPLVPIGASYGLDAQVSNLTTGQNILQANKTKIDDSITIFKDYI